MSKLGLWLRWSWRDLRARWVQVVVVALIIALGTGGYAGLSSSTTWRIDGTHTTYDQLNLYDLRVTLTSGSYLSPDELRAAARSIDHTDWIDQVEPRLSESTFVRVPTGDDEPLMVRGTLIGVDTRRDGPHISQLHLDRGRSLSPDDDGQPVAVVDQHFADYYDLDPGIDLTLSGGHTLRTVGHVLSAEHLIIMTVEGGVFAQGSQAIVFVPLTTAQAITGHPDAANELVLTLNPPPGTGYDEAVATVQADLEHTLAEAFPAVGMTIGTRRDDYVHEMVFDNVSMSQDMYEIMAYLFLAGAMFGAFNLTNRIVEAERRQIGIGMALGMPPRLLAVRPLLVGVQIALVGVVLGLALGLLMSAIMSAWVKSLFPMPGYGRYLQPDIFVRAAVLGFVLPVLATLFPVWRAVRVQPVDAIKTGHLVAKGGGFSHWIQRPLPGRSFVQIPVRNLLRAPRRTLLTALGISSAIITLVAMTGIVNSAERVIEIAQDEFYQDHPQRQLITLDSVYPVESPVMSALTTSDAVGAAVPAIRVPGTAQRGDTTFDVIIDVIDLDNSLWSPTVVSGTRPTAVASGDTPAALTANRPGVLVAEGAARDLGLGVGDTFVLEHPQRTGLLSYQFVTTEVEIAGIHADPWRMYVYLDDSQTSLLNLDGVANMLHVTPQTGVSERALQARLLEQPGVASMVSLRTLLEANEFLLDQIFMFLSVVQVAVMAMAFLVAFNSTSINLHERTREVATMFAFGLPVRTVTRMIMLENLLVGSVGTLIGIGAGVLVERWILIENMAASMPNLQMPVVLTTATVMLVLLIGVGLVALTPLITVRRMARMDLPSTLRVME